MVGDQTQQAGALDLTQISDAVNRIGGGDKRRRNEMMRQGLSDPNAFALQNKEAIQQPNQPTEFLGSGRTDNVPSVSYNGEQLSMIDNSHFDALQAKMPEVMDKEYAPSYSNDSGKYYTSGNLKSLSGLYNTYDYLNNLSNSMPTYHNGKELGTDENGITSYEQVADPIKRMTLTDFYSQYGTTPAGGWSDANTKGLNGIFRYRAQGGIKGWENNSSLLPKGLDLYGSGTPEEISRGFNVLQNMSTQNIGEFFGLAPDVQKGMLQHPDIALQQMRATANPANGDWLSIGAEGGLQGISDWQWNQDNGLTPREGSYLDIHGGDSWGGIASAIGTAMMFIPGMQGFGAALNAVNAAAHDNPLGMAMAAFGGMGGFDALGGASDLGNGLSSGASSGLTSGGGNLGLSVGSGLGQGVGQNLGNLSQLASGIGSGISNIFGNSALTSGLQGFRDNLASTLGVSSQTAGGLLSGAIHGLASGNGIEGVLRGAASGGVGSFAGDQIAGMTKAQFGDSISKMAGGAASGGLNSLFNKGDVINGSLFGGMSGGLHALLNSTSQSLTPEDNKNNKGLARVASNLVQNQLRKK